MNWCWGVDGNSISVTVSEKTQTSVRCQQQTTAVLMLFIVVSVCYITQFNEQLRQQ
jgi:hypothetical protein